jgi:hypothetical protein
LEEFGQKADQRHAGLIIVRAAGKNSSVFDCCRPRSVPPTALVAGGHDVDVGFEQQRASTAASWAMRKYIGRRGAAR